MNESTQRRRHLLAAFLIPLVAGCSPSPRPIAYGQDGCETCLMGISDERWGSEIVTRTGKAHTFDSVECMVAFLLHEAAEADVHSLWVTDFAAPPTLIPVDRAFFLPSDNLRSPMGLGITVFGEGSIRRVAVKDSFGGDVLSWDEVVAYVSRQWPEGGPHARPRVSRLQTDDHDAAEANRADRHE